MKVRKTDMSNMSELKCTLNDLVTAPQNMLNAANKLKDSLSL